MTIKARPSLLLLILAAVFLAAPSYAKPKLGNIQFERKSTSRERAGIGPATFPHDSHEATLECKECHPKIFKAKRGANDITMKKNMEGKYCGSPGCHNTNAFPLYECAKCHTKVRGIK